MGFLVSLLSGPIFRIALPLFSLVAVGLTVSSCDVPGSYTQRIEVDCFPDDVKEEVTNPQILGPFPLDGTDGTIWEDK